jgi:hypothetical protein
MIYRITYYSGAMAAGDDTCNGSLERAKELAVGAVESGIAQRTEVRDLNRILHFHFPRTCYV